MQMMKLVRTLYHNKYVLQKAPNKIFEEWRLLLLSKHFLKKQLKNRNEENENMDNCKRRLFVGAKCPRKQPSMNIL